MSGITQAPAVFTNEVSAAHGFRILKNSKRYQIKMVSTFFDKFHYVFAVS